VAGLTLIDRLPDPASALTQAGHEASGPEDENTLGEVAHRAAATSETESREVLSYWTAERMAAAQPLTSMIDDTLDLDVLPHPDDDVEHQNGPHANSEGDPWTTGGEVTHTTGKVFLTMNGRDFTCSASVVDSSNK